ncbi:hypothetical protein H6F32_15635 [Anabaena sp. FACHB-1237]|uniref:hypothetical protein n=1 Tax=Anabaena sp. FACHB-1237 TaxID=2692769 RepID=UPI0016808B23|nr:hypothetical protein [Anabaena sp. FACHB-1237]MBD2138969.1 hypothetical protein [Anabaena sp. FACHB-1237]
MTITARGIIERRLVGLGAWAFVTEDGKTYQILKSTNPSLLQSGLKVEITGKLRPDLVTNAMIGTVLEVSNFVVIS